VILYSITMRNLIVDRLSDHFGQYRIYLTCECGHIRKCSPHALAGFVSWDARLEDVVRRLRCSKCGKKQCTARVVEPVEPRGYRDQR
jgi:hypothetical protein